MNMVLIVSFVALFTAVCKAMIKKATAEIAFLLSTASLVLILLLVLPSISEVIDSIEQLADSSELYEVFSVLIKALGIALTAGIAGRMCDDAGEKALALGVELSAKVVITAIMLSPLNQFLQLIREILIS